MNDLQELALRIKQTTKNKGITLKQLLDACNLNINYISDISRGKNATILNISKIATYLDCSIDYLLGRTDNPDSHKK
ncbi:MAG: helix-turn-helix domain-containing protein [Oscillospiraceae bacterium]